MCMGWQILLGQLEPVFVNGGGNTFLGCHLNCCLLKEIWMLVLAQLGPDNCSRGTIDKSQFGDGH